MPALQLPEDPKLLNAALTVMDSVVRRKGVSKKRKRPHTFESDGNSGYRKEISLSGNSDTQSEEITRDVGITRLEKLSNLQTRMIEHAFSFPAANRITYSTCSIHVQENEVVVSRALRTEIAQQRGWRVMRREEQPDGLKRWPYRGLDISTAIAADLDPSREGALHCLSEEDRQACIRCHAGDEEGTMGFFVCGFTRKEDASYSNGEAGRGAPRYVEDDDWEGFSDDGDVR
jgi:putative methyltransferase